MHRDIDTLVASLLNTAKECEANATALCKSSNHTDRSKGQLLWLEAGQNYYAANSTIQGQNDIDIPADLQHQITQRSLHTAGRLLDLDGDGETRRMQLWVSLANYNLVASYEPDLFARYAGEITSGTTSLIITEGFHNRLGIALRELAAIDTQLAFAAIEDFRDKADHPRQNVGQQLFARKWINHQADIIGERIGKPRYPLPKFVY